MPSGVVANEERGVQTAEKRMSFVFGDRIDRMWSHYLYDSQDVNRKDLLLQGVEVVAYPADSPPKMNRFSE
jgi:hypothetical protein